VRTAGKQHDGWGASPGAHLNAATATPGPVWQGSGSLENSSGSGSSGGAASLLDLEPF